MSEAKLLRLKSEKYAGEITPARRNPIARVLVDSSIFHLEEVLDYVVPEKIDELAQAGVLVKVTINGQPVSGYILSRSEQAYHAGKLRFIEKVISPLPLFTTQLSDLIATVAHRYASKKWDVIRSAIPERVANVEKNLSFSAKEIKVKRERISGRGSSLSAQYTNRLKNNEKIRWAINTGTRFDPLIILAEIISNLDTDRQCLIVVPDQSDIAILVEQLNTQLGIFPLQVGSHLSKAERYFNYLQLSLSHPQIIIGTRSAIFSPLSENGLVIVVSDNDESMYEKRSPGWNVRDVALLRAGEQSLIFLSNSLSLEVVRLTNLGWLEAIALTGNSPRRLSFSDSLKSDHQVIAAGLRHGSVIVSVADPGFIPSFLCQNCRNVAICDCGGKLLMAEGDLKVSCSACLREHLQWTCTYCGLSRPWAIKRGAKRVSHELGKAFPGTSVLTSIGDKRLGLLPPGNHLVISTVGCEPSGSYAGACLLDGELLFNRTGLRAQERARDSWAKVISMVKSDGEVFIDLPNAHPNSQFLLQGNIWRRSELEIQQRDEVHLPPNYRCATLSGPSADIVQVLSALEGHSEFHTIGPIPLDLERSKILFKIATQQGHILSDFLFDLQRYRSLKGLAALTVRMDPFDL